MTAPQITMVIIIIWTTYTTFSNMIKHDNNTSQITISLIASLTRAATLIGVLWWGGFWG